MVARPLNGLSIIVRKSHLELIGGGQSRRLDAENGVLDPAFLQTLGEVALTFCRELDLDASRAAVACDPDALHLHVWREQDLDENVSDATIGYAWESVLPIDAESLVADWKTCKGSVFSLAARVSQIWPIVQALEHGGIKIQTIGSDLLWIAQSMAASTTLSDSQRTLRIEGESSVEVMSFVEGHLAAWGRVGENESEIATEAAAQRFALSSMLSDSVSRQNAEVPIAWRVDRKQSLEFVDQMTSNVVAGKQTPWFELRRGILASHDPLRDVRGPLERSLLLLTIALLLVSGAIIWRSHRWNQISRDANEQMQQTFKKTWPEQRVPAAIVKRVQSEHTRILRQRSTSGPGADQVPAITPATDVLAPLLTAIATVQTKLSDEQSFGLVVESMDIVNGEFVLEVELPDYESAGLLTSELQTSGLSTDAPSSSRSRTDRVESQIRGRKGGP